MTVKEWLESVGCYDVEPVKVTIGRTTYEGARYRKTVQPLPGARSQEPHEEEVIYLLGALPPSYERTSRVAYQFEGDGRDWYVAAWVSPTAAVHPSTAHYHPFGCAFQLRPWGGSNGRIDALEERPYKRIGVVLGAGA